MLHSLPLFHRISGQPVIVLGSGDAAQAKRRLVERAGGVIVGAEDQSARLAFVALDDPERATAALKARGLLVNVPDRPELCDFTVPSLLERGPVVIAVGTGGVSAGLAKALRLRLEAVLPQSLGVLADALGAARAALRARWPDARDRRLALDAALDAGAPLDPLAEFDDQRFSQWLAGFGAVPLPPAEFTVCSDDPDDLTLRQARWLGRADLVLHDPTVAPAILARARADAARQVFSETGETCDDAGFVVIIRRG
jgi:uroporphyrin-III C-methyltransferase / precorrin-2 dehydrogenase / sirohydrochlorin ferrochelatase